MNKLAQLERDNYVRGVLDTIDNLDAPLSVKLASVDLLLTKEAGLEEYKQKAKDILAKGQSGLRNAVEVGKSDVKDLLNRGIGKAQSSAANLIRKSGVVPQIPLALGVEQALAGPASSPSFSDRLRFLEGGEVGAARRAAAIEQAALSASPVRELALYQGGGPLVPAGGGGPLVPGGGGPLVPAGVPGRSMSAAQEAEAASSRLGRFLPKTRLGKAGLGVAGLGALGLGANYLMGEDEPASFSDRLMSGDLSPEEMAALGLGGAALGTGAYYVGKKLL